VPDKSTTNIPARRGDESWECSFVNRRLLAFDGILRESTASENFVWDFLLNIRNSSVKIVSPKKAPKISLAQVYF